MSYTISNSSTIASNRINTKSLEKSATTTKKISVFSNFELTLAYSFFVVWVFFFIDFVFWYFFNSYSTDITFFTLTTFNIFWLPCLALYFFVFSLRQVDYPKEFIQIPDGKIALLTTKIPSEPFTVVKKTLKSMLAQEKINNFDVWLCDEDPSEETTNWCKRNKVNISTRRGDENYHRVEHPRKRKCKEGNLAYFYDHYGYENYDFAIQFDADHAPEKDFAFEVMKHFNNEEVGYVASPAIIDANTNESWTVKARNYWESTTHGPIQSGSQNGFAPVCFGSHYSVRIKALKQIGGIGEDVAEDYTTTLMMNANGWKGSFARNAIAHGMGAVGVADCMQQEYQWSLVGMRAFFVVARKVFLKMPWMVKLQMFVWSLWYPAVTLISLISILLPVYALWFNQTPFYTDNGNFWIKYLILNFGFIIYVIWLKNLNHLRPTWSWQVSWETLVFQLLQLPWIFIGWVEGVYQIMTGFNPFAHSKKLKITDKVNSSAKSIELKWFIPHFIIITFCLIPLFVFETTRPYYIFAQLSALSFSIAVFIGVLLSIKEVKIFDKYKNATRKYIAKHLPTISISLILFILSLSTILKYFL
jgi:cellulose synthase (UDP-forming)